MTPMKADRCPTRVTRSSTNAPSDFWSPRIITLLKSPRLSKHSKGVRTSERNPRIYRENFALQGFCFCFCFIAFEDKIQLQEKFYRRKQLIREKASLTKPWGVVKNFLTRPKTSPCFGFDGVWTSRLGSQMTSTSARSREDGHSAIFFKITSTSVTLGSVHRGAPCPWNESLHGNRRRH